MGSSASNKSRTSRPATKSKGQHGGPRANSGGARAGAGRKQARLPSEVLARIGEVPTDPLVLQEWYTRAISVVQWEVMQGRPYVGILEQLQRSAKAVSIPEAIKAKAARMLRQNDDERERDAATSAGDEPAERRPDGAPRNKPLRRDPA